jgi:chromosome segregation ATPase
MTTETNDDNVERLRAEVERLRAEVERVSLNYREAREVVKLRDRDNDRLVKHAVDVSRELASTRAELDALGVQYEAQRARLALAHVVVDAALAMHEALSRPVGEVDGEEQQARMHVFDEAVSRWRAVPGAALSLEAHGGDQ